LEGYDKARQADMGKRQVAAECAAVLVYATFPSKELAVSTGRRLIEARLAGCINVLPSMTSVYRWNGNIETAQEAVLIAKTMAGQADAVTQHILAHHPYETPAVLVLPVVSGSLAYLSWIESETASGASLAG
jgi:periplasmic divalent cation tolerance protein